MRAAWLTWRINRFEILFVLAVAALVAASAWVVAAQIRGLGLTDALCWPRTQDAGYATPACDRMMESFWPLTSQAALIRVVLTIAPALLGVILGVPVVARELELRTASFSWALTPSRWRWLLARFVPMLLVGVAGLVVVAWAGTMLFDALWLGRYGPDLTEVAAEGVALVARGLAAVAVALLIGSLVGRTMPALLVGVVVLGGWGLFVVPRAQAILADQRTVWQVDDAWRDGGSYLEYLEQGTFDQTRPGLPGEPGARVDEYAWNDNVQGQIEQACGASPDGASPDGASAAPDYDYQSPEYQAWDACAQPFWEQRPTAEYAVWDLVVPRSAWGDFVTLDVIMSALLGGVALLLTVVVVRYRRPE